jgi:hypothetical protein
MKFYNPFKAHVVLLVSTGRFAVRKLTLIGWKYLDLDGSYWWVTPEYVWKHCGALNKDNALNALVLHKQYKDRLKVLVNETV